MTKEIRPVVPVPKNLDNLVSDTPDTKIQSQNIQNAQINPITYTQKGLDLGILVRDNKPRTPGDLEFDQYRQFIKLFGVEFGFFKRNFGGKSKSSYMSKENLARILLDNKLVNSLQEGLKEIQPYLKGKSIAEILYGNDMYRGAKFVRYIHPIARSEVYRCEYYDNSPGDDFY